MPPLEILVDGGSTPRCQTPDGYEVYSDRAHYHSPTSSCYMLSEGYERYDEQRASWSPDPSVPSPQPRHRNALEGQKVDSMAKQIYAATTITTKMQTYISYMLAYIFNLTNTIESHLEQVPADSRAVILAADQESHRVTKQLVANVRHYVSCFSRVMATAVALRRYAWLKTTALQPDVKQRIKDLPFDSCGLFHRTTDDALKDVDESCKWAKNLGIYTPYQQQPQRQRIWRPQYNRCPRSPAHTEIWRH
ncbi:UNVERIFIED_CONTAM: hypothetical protein K2H54_061221 [Gekko kuhli]